MKKAAVVLTIITDTEVTAHVISDEVKTMILDNQTYWLIKQQVIVKPVIQPIIRQPGASVENKSRPTTNPAKSAYDKSYNSRTSAQKADTTDKFELLKLKIKETVDACGKKGLPARELAPAIKPEIQPLYENKSIPIGAAITALFKEHELYATGEEGKRVYFKY